MQQTVHRLVDSLARDSTSRLVAALARRLGTSRIAVAEDAVQHALMQALSLWPFKGVPDKPEAWLDGKPINLINPDALKKKTA